MLQPGRAVNPDWTNGTKLAEMDIHLLDDHGVRGRLVYFAYHSYIFILSCYDSNRDDSKVFPEEIFGYFIP